MQEAIVNFLQLNVQNSIVEIHVAIGLAYLVLTFVMVIDAIQNSHSSFARWIWCLVIFLLPFLGMYFYVIKSFAQQDFAVLSRFGIGRKS
jgi:predicted metallopeptidase